MRVTVKRKKEVRPVESVILGLEGHSTLAVRAAMGSRGKALLRLFDAPGKAEVWADRMSGPNEHYDQTYLTVERLRLLAEGLAGLADEIERQAGR